MVKRGRAAGGATGLSGVLFKTRLPGVGAGLSCVSCTGVLCRDLFVFVGVKAAIDLVGRRSKQIL
jgi:hypothetical protein